MVAEHDADQIIRPQLEETKKLTYQHFSAEDVDLASMVVPVVAEDNFVDHADKAKPTVNLQGFARQELPEPQMVPITVVSEEIIKDNEKSPAPKTVKPEPQSIIIVKALPATDKSVPHIFEKQTEVKAPANEPQPAIKQALDYVESIIPVPPEKTAEVEDVKLVDPTEVIFEPEENLVSENAQILDAINGDEPQLPKEVYPDQISVEIIEQIAELELAEATIAETIVDEITEIIQQLEESEPEHELIEAELIELCIQLFDMLQLHYSDDAVQLFVYSLMTKKIDASGQVIKTRLNFDEGTHERKHYNFHLIQKLASALQKKASNSSMLGKLALDYMRA